MKLSFVYGQVGGLIAGLLVFLLCFIPNVSATDYNLSINLTHYFDYNSDVNLPDRVNTSLVGTYSSAVTTTAGKLQNAVHLTGTQRVGFTSSPYLGQSFTLNYWHKQNGFDSSGGVMPLVYSVTAQLIYYQADNKLSLSLGGAGYTNLEDFGTLVNDNTYHMVTIIRNNLYVDVYIDGIFWKNGALNDNIPLRFNDLNGWRDDAGYDFIGDFDDFAMWQSRLSAAQVKFLYNNGTGRNFTQLSNITPVIYYPNLTISNILPTGSNFNPTIFSWTTNHSAGCDFYLGEDLNKSIFTNVTTTFNYTLTNGTYTYKINCTDSNNKKADSGTITFKVVNRVAEILSLNVCPATTANVGVVAILVFICLVLILLGFLFRVGIVGVFGSLMMFPLSWSLVACSHLFGYLLALCGMALFFIFAVLIPSRRGLWG